MNTINKKESIVLVNAIFYLFTFTFVLGILLFPIMLFTGLPLLHSSIISIAIGASFPTILLVMFVRMYPLVQSKTDALFHKFSLPLIGLEKSSFGIINLQNKFFGFLLDCSIVIVIFFTLSIMPFIKSIEFVYIMLRLMLLLSIWLVTFVMAIDGFCLYFKCLLELLCKFCESKNIDVLFKDKLNNILAFCKKMYEDVTYKPKRLKRNFSVSNLILLFTPSIAGRREQYIP